MFDFLKFGRNKEKSRSFRYKMAASLDGRHIKYVTERENYEDSVIGRDGALIVKDDELLVYSSSDVVFRAKISELDASELMSKEGVILTGPDIEHDEIERTVIAYYTYYIK